MEFTIYDIQGEEKLSNISEKYGISIKEIKRMNPEVRFFKVLFDGEWVAAQQRLKIPIKIIDTKIRGKEEKLLNNLYFEPIARYRCTQINITKALNDITFSSDIKSQYLLSSAQNEKKYFYIQLEDYIYKIDPRALEVSFELVKPIEFIKNNIKFSQNDNAQIDKILNIRKIEKDWLYFRENKLPKINFYKQLKSQSKKAANDFITTGNIEFSNEKVFKNNLYKNLFYYILLKSNIGDNLKDYLFTQYSQIFPEQQLEVKVKKKKIAATENITKFKLVGELQKDKLSEENLIKQYNEIYQPLLKYAFTEFNYIYRIIYTLDNKTGLLLDAKASLNEKVKNNFETITQFELNQVEL